MAGLDAAPETFQQSVREGREPHPNPGFRQLVDVVNKGEVFDRLWTHPSMLTLVASVLPDFKLFSLNGLDPKPGCGHQPFHRDTLAGPEPNGDWTIVNSVWMLDEFRHTNGATRVVSESHVRGDVDGGPGSPSVRYAEAPAGSVRPLVLEHHLSNSDLVLNGCCRCLSSTVRHCTAARSTHLAPDAVGCTAHGLCETSRSRRTSSSSSGPAPRDG